MSRKDEIAMQWKQAEKAMFEEAFQRLIDEATKNTKEYLQEHPFQRSKFTLFFNKIEKALGTYSEERQLERDKIDFGESRRYDLALKLAEGDPVETKRITDINEWIKTVFTARMVIGNERTSVSLEFLRNAMRAYASTEDEYEFLKKFLPESGFGKQKAYATLPDIQTNGRINIGIGEAMAQFMTVLSEQYGIHSVEDLADAMGEK